METPYPTFLYWLERGVNMIRIKELREERREIQDEIAMAMNVNQGMVSKWENGTVQPDIEMLTKLAQYFNVSIDYLIGYSNNRNPANLTFSEYLKQYMIEKFERSFTDEDIDTVDKILGLLEKYKERPDETFSNR